jgi:hypothetical protein
MTHNPFSPLPRAGIVDVVVDDDDDYDAPGGNREVGFIMLHATNHDAV